MKGGLCNRGDRRFLSVFGEAASTDIHGEPVMSTNTTNASAERRMKDLDINLPRPPTPLGAYVEAVQSGNLLFLGGPRPVGGGDLKFLGRLGDDVTFGDEMLATRAAASNEAAHDHEHFGVLERKKH